jgi:hypothetical protein
MISAYGDPPELDQAYRVVTEARPCYDGWVCCLDFRKGRLHCSPHVAHSPRIKHESFNHYHNGE